MSISKSKGGSKYFVFTSFNEDNYEIFKHLDLSQKGIRYICYQLEISKDNNKHLQGYIEFKGNKTSLNSIKKLLNDNTIHLEQRRGTQQQAIDYCKKSETSIKPFFESGEPMPQRQGKRTDFTNLRDKVKNGATLSSIIDTDPGMFYKYAKHIKEHINIVKASKIKTYEKPAVYILYGDTQTGKTKYVYDHHKLEDIYSLPKGNQNNVWFNNYTNEPILLLDDFYGWIKYSYLLNLTDGYKLQLETKGGYCYKKWNTVYITSNKHPDEWYKHIYPNGMEPALKRRITEIMHFKYNEENQKPSEPIYSTIINGVKTYDPPKDESDDEEEG
ncbi:replication-associated protein [Crucivirus-182]|nr:replication-associated protein [Crucivirus-182]